MRGLTFLCLAAAALALANPASAQTRYPFLPHLVVDNDPHICKPFLAAVQERFKGPDHVVELDGKDWPGISVRWVFNGSKLKEDRSNFDASRQENVLLHRADVDSDGIVETIALVNGPYGHAESYELWLFPSSAITESPADLAKLMDDAAPARGQRIASSVGWAPSVVEIEGNYYRPSRASDLHDDQSDYRLERIGAGAAAPPVCQVALEPEVDKDKEGLERVLALLPTDQTRNFIRLLADIAGGEGHCGTLRSNSRRADRAVQNVRLAVLRPWVLLYSSDDRYNSRATVEASLAEWGGQSLWNFRLYRQLPQAEQLATVDFKWFYRQEFGLDDREALRVVDLLFRSHFVFGSRSVLPWTDTLLQRNPGILSQQEVYYVNTQFEPSAPRLETRFLKRLLLLGATEQRDRNRIKNLINAGAEIGRIEARDKETGDDHPLVFALEHPDLVQFLLDHDADVDGPNLFGKTPLMFAAQFGLLDSAELLLDKGAKVDARTKPLEGCRFNVLTGDRTALSYAAQYGHLALIQLLLERGADGRAKDGSGRSVADFLKEAPMSEADRTAALELLRVGANP